MLLGALGFRLLGSLLTGKELAGEGTIRATQDI